MVKTPWCGQPSTERAREEAVVEFGYTMLCEQAGPKQLVRDARMSEDVGFDFAVISDHYFPWLDVQGHSPYAWAVLGAVAQATSRIPLMTYVTCPIKRYHPAVVAQKAAMIAVEPRRELGWMFDECGGAGKPRIGQLAVSYGSDPEAAKQRAHEQFRWFTGGWSAGSAACRVSPSASAPCR